MNLFDDRLTLIKKFRKVAGDIINSDYNGIKEWARAKESHYNVIEPIIDSDEFNEDLKKYVDIKIKYENKGVDIPFLLGYLHREDQIGQFLVDDELMPLDEDDLKSEEGITIIMSILDLLGIDYGCKECLARPACQKLNPDLDCDKIENIIDGSYMNPMIIEIFSRICEYSQIRPMG